MKKRIYYENLDSIRFFCFLSVFFYHSFFTNYDYIKHSDAYVFIKHGIFANGNLGVNCFFVLSGFLITTLLIEEKKLNGNINLPFFWVRRILRIWPLFYLCVFLGLIIFPILKHAVGQSATETAHPVYYLLFINNFDILKNGFPDASILGVLWSVAVEEQFYLLWPIVVYIFPLKKLWIPFVLILLFNLIFRARYDTYEMHEMHTISCIGDMTIGAIGAWLMETSGKFSYKIKSQPKLQIAAVYILFAVVYFFRQQLLMENHIIRIFERLFIALLIIFIILEQTFSTKSLFKLSKLPTISKLGKITYGLYCLHFLGILIALNITKKAHINTNFWEVMIIETAIALTFAILLSIISFKYFELPFLRLKKRFEFIYR